MKGKQQYEGNNMCNNMKVAICAICTANQVYLYIHLIGCNVPRVLRSNSFFWDDNMD